MNLFQKLDIKLFSKKKKTTERASLFLLGSLVFIASAISGITLMQYQPREKSHLFFSSESVLAAEDENRAKNEENISSGDNGKVSEVMAGGGGVVKNRGGRRESG